MGDSGRPDTMTDDARSLWITGAGGLIGSHLARGASHILPGWRIVPLARQVASRLKEGAVVCDVGSVKGEICRLGHEAMISEGIPVPALYPDPAHDKEFIRLENVDDIEFFYYDYRSPEFADSRSPDFVRQVDESFLDFVRKSAHLRNNIARILLWIDPKRGISVQQQFFEPGESDYRLAKYSDIQINQKLPDDAFKLKTTKKTKFLPPQG